MKPIRRVVVGSIAVTLFVFAAPFASGPADGASSGSGAPRVTLKSAGAAPRSPMRLTLTSDTSTAATMQFSESIDQSLDGTPTNSVDVPPIRFVVHTNVGTVEANGNAPIDYSYSDVGVVDDGSLSAAQLSQLKDALSPLASLTGSGTITSRNQIIDSEVSGTEALDPSVAQITDQFSDQLGSLAVPFPREAVGVGAKWRGVSSLQVNGINTTQTYDYTLRSREGSVVVFDFTFTQTAPRQRVKLPGVPSSAKVEISRYRVSGRGSMTVDLAQPLPVEGTSRGGGTQAFKITAQGESGTLTQKLALDVAISPPPETASE
jgi:hypothetical protein